MALFNYTLYTFLTIPESDEPLFIRILIKPKMKKNRSKHGHYFKQDQYQSERYREMMACCIIIPSVVVFIVIISLARSQKISAAQVVHSEKSYTEISK
jgi:hypothetical protein